jgi:hypothetical protein
MSGAVPGSRSALVRLLVAAGVGWLVGEYLALEVVPGQFVLQVRGVLMSYLAFDAWDGWCSRVAGLLVLRL